MKRLGARRQNRHFYLEDRKDSLPFVRAMLFVMAKENIC